jgi:hypothetical protein
LGHPALSILAKPAAPSPDSAPAETKLDRARVGLLDLSARNGLPEIPCSAEPADILEMVDEPSDEGFRLLVRENRPFHSFQVDLRRKKNRRKTKSPNWRSPNTMSWTSAMFSRHTDIRL